MLSIYYVFVGIKNGTPNPMPGYVKTEKTDSPLAQYLDKPKWTFSIPRFSPNVEAALRSEKNVEYVWHDAIEQIVGYLRSKDAMMRNASEYEEFGRNLIKKYLSLSQQVTKEWVRYCLFLIIKRCLWCFSSKNQFILKIVHLSMELHAVQAPLFKIK